MTTYLSNYERYLKFVNNEGTERQALCPFHEDSVPSLSVNIDTGAFICFACGAKGNWEQFEERIETKSVPEIEIAQAHKDLMLSRPITSFLVDKRGLSMDTLEKYLLGYDGSRIWIPIKDKDGNFVNVRKYKPFSNANKVIGYDKGYNAARLFPLEALEQKAVYIFEGEMDTLLARSKGINGITQTGGATSWNTKFNGLFSGKDVFIIYDNDEPGRNGSDMVAKALKPVAKSVRIVELPLDEDKEDFTDFIVKYGNNIEKFLEYCDSADDLKAQTEEQQIEDVVYEIDLASSSNSQYYRRNIVVPVLIIGKDLAPYLIPKRVKLTCSGGGKTCGGCPLSEGKDMTLDFESTDDEILEMISSNNSGVKGIIYRKAGLQCGSRSFRFNCDVLESVNVECFSAVPDVDRGMVDESPYVCRELYYVGHDLKANCNYLMTGKSLPHPKTQMATLLLKDAAPAQDSIDAFKIAEVAESLEVFWL